jgi:adenylate cyclase
VALRIFSLARRHPFAGFFLLVILSNVAGSYFNVTYNQELIVSRLTEPQARAFWRIVLPTYNAVAYTGALAAILYFILPLRRCREALLAGRPVSSQELWRCRRLLVNLPLYQVWLNLLGWLPGAVLFPLGICLLGGWEGAASIWTQFCVSFTVSALLTTMQTYFLLETFLVETLYRELFRDARPAEIEGAMRLTLGQRIFLLWCAVAVVPVTALLAVALNFTAAQSEHFDHLRRLAVGVAIVGLPFSGFLMWMVGRGLLVWVRAMGAATAAIARGDYQTRLGEERPDELGQLTDRFNDMASALERGEALRETFGQFVSPAVRDEIIEHHHGLGGEVRVVTVLFVDIRGFTRRSEGQPPEASVSLLNRFLTLAVAAVEEGGGWVNKFLGDGVMALFGAPRPREEHADLALNAARDMIRRLETLNAELAREGQAPLAVGIGIHTGPALVGCVGATLPDADGRQRVRRELTAMGETVNLAQRLEQLTKSQGGPILLSAATRAALKMPADLPAVGAMSLPGLEGAVEVFRG